MARTYSRREFYDLVWSKPITHIAKDFALSDVAIHKICRKHEIPTPPPGYWAKRNAGKAAVQTKLPKTPRTTSDKVTIAAPELRGETAAVPAARETARVRASDEPVGAVSHPIIERTLAGLRAASPSHRGLVSVEGPDVINCEIAPASIDRLGEILKRIMAAVEQQDFHLEVGERRARFHGDGETIGLSVTETFKREKHKWTAEEEAAEAAWRRKTESRRGNPWDWERVPYPTVPEWDYICTGQLGIEMEGTYVASGQEPRKTFRDGKVQKLETLASDIAVALAVLAVVKREERERRAEEEFIAERRRACLDGLLEDMARLERLRSLEQSLSRMEAKPEHGRVSTFVPWVRAELLRREAMLSLDGMEARFQAERIFGEDDDHGFQSSAWRRQWSVSDVG